MGQVRSWPALAGLGVVISLAASCSLDRAPSNDSPFDPNDRIQVVEAPQDGAGKDFFGDPANGVVTEPVMTGQSEAGPMSSTIPAVPGTSQCVGAGCTDGMTPDGAACSSGPACVSGYCNSGLCCAGGRCCVNDDECIAEGTGAICDEPDRCQGKRGIAHCEDHHCLVTAPSADDDSACTAMVVADECGAYPAIACTGERDQAPPRCADACATDRDCDAQAHCNEGRCLPDVVDGGACAADHECVSGHCDSELCCADGSCCTDDTQCPVNEPVCQDESTCQGERVTMRCDEHFQCVTGPSVEDDSGCTAETRALSCDALADVYCNGTEVQTPPACGLACLSNDDCDDAYYCNLGACRLDEPNGGLCNRDSQCASNHCRNLRCCDSGECCSLDATCQQVLGSAPVCDDADNCSGHWDSARCDWTTFRCIPQVFSTNVGCADVQVDDCSPYMPGRLFCGDGDGRGRPRCPTSCSSDSDCLDPYQCIRSRCALECTNDSGCDLDQRCANNRCVIPCDGDGACPGTTVCEMGVCRPECTNSNECPGEEFCRNNVCVQPDPEPGQDPGPAPE